MLITQWIILVLFAVIGIAITIGIYIEADNKRTGTISLLITIFVIFALVVGFIWFNTSTASGIRAVKDQKAELSNGLDREIILTAEDGREIFYYDGKCDIEIHDEYILFEDENDKRVIIYRGVQDTLLIVEK